MFLVKFNWRSFFALQISRISKPLQSQNLLFHHFQVLLSSNYQPFHQTRTLTYCRLNKSACTASLCSLLSACLTRVVVLKFVFFVVNTLSFLCFIHIEHVINLLSLSYSSQLCFFNHELWNFRSTFLDLVKLVSVSFLPSGNETGGEVKLLSSSSTALITCYSSNRRINGFCLVFILRGKIRQQCSSFLFFGDEADASILTLRANTLQWRITSSTLLYWLAKIVAPNINTPEVWFVHIMIQDIFIFAPKFFCVFDDSFPDFLFATKIVWTYFLATFVKNMRDYRNFAASAEHCTSK